MSTRVIQPGGAIVAVQRNRQTATGAAVQLAANNNWQTFIANPAANFLISCLCISVTVATNAANVLAFGTGAAGSEVNWSTFIMPGLPANTLVRVPFVVPWGVFSSGVRLAWRWDPASAAPQVSTIGVIDQLFPTNFVNPL